MENPTNTELNDFLFLSGLPLNKLSPNQIQTLKQLYTERYQALNQGKLEMYIATLRIINNLEN